MSERPDAGEIPNAEPFVEVTSCAAFTVTDLFLNSVAAKQNSGERVRGEAALYRERCVPKLCGEKAFTARGGGGTVPICVCCAPSVGWVLLSTGEYAPGILWER